ncbi:hypothetical protein F4604DRAFT_1809221 [Suillus subluteus]|nr:hypothetical protein F4604DRAFT_1809221 [Suillus subluteus]
MQNLEMCSKIYSRARSSEQNDPSVSLAALRKALHFTFTAANVSRDPAEVWHSDFRRMGYSHSPEDFDWLVDYLDYIYSDDHEVAYDILLLLASFGVRCSPAKQHLLVESLVACMGSTMPEHLHHAALRVACNAREQITSIDVINDARLRDMVLTKLFPAILTVVCLRPRATPADDDPDPFFYEGRDLCYLELAFALARNPDWHPHLCGDRHIDWCISMIAESCEFPTSCAFYIAGILLRIAPEQLSVTSLTEKQWWDAMRSPWLCDSILLEAPDYYELLPDLAEGTKKHMQIAPKSDLEELIKNRGDPEQEDGTTIAVRELRTVASDMLEKLVDGKGVISA